MIVQLNELPNGFWDSDACIVGSGVAGLTIARRLLADGWRVTLVESGGADYDDLHQQLNDAENIGFDYYALIDSRLRMFGGTTAIWGGRCAPLDAIDFERRPWMPHSGWPLSAAEMIPYYRAARQLVGLPVDGPQDCPKRRRQDDRLGLRRDGFELTRWEFDGKHDRFQFHNSRDVLDHPNATVLLHSTVTQLKVGKSGRRIDAAMVRNRDGGAAILRAGHFILAAGGLENPRLLLASNDYFPSGIGNGHDLVGRFFMEHPRARGGTLETDRPLTLLREFYRLEAINGVRTVSLLRPTDDLQAEAGLLNHGLSIMAIKPAGRRTNLVIRIYDFLRSGLSPNRKNRFLWRAMKNGALWLNRQAEPFISAALVKGRLRELALIIRAEQSPNPDSRVLLSDERDALGMPKIKLDWRFQAIDKDSVRAMVEKFDDLLRRRGLGRVRPAPWLYDPAKPWEIDPLVGFHPIGGYHHMGTTRMGRTPADGVVDGDAKVFGVDNLFIAGASVFSTGGWANPTLTIAALSLRLADHVAARLAADNRPMDMVGAEPRRAVVG